MSNLEEKYLERLSEEYPTISAASTEIINLQAILNLPKGTEHFLTDIHGEYEAFLHVLKNGSGSVKRKIDEVFGNTLSRKDKKALATLIYYPKEKLKEIGKTEENMADWYKITLYRLVEISKHVAEKYTRSKVRKALPQDFAYIIEELITEKAELADKELYYNEIVNTIIRLDRAEPFIIALSELIQRLTVDHLHIIGDIFDRGPGPHIIMDRLLKYHSVDIQWGNHDVLWMGAAAGQKACIANVIRNCARYANLDVLEDGYGINLLPLATFANQAYHDDPCECFKLRGNTDYNELEVETDVRIHKAIAIIQFKLEGQMILQNPEFKMESRLLLDKIDYAKGTIMLEGREYALLDTYFPTIDPQNPYALTPEEEDIMDRLEKAFLGCEKLQEHARFLLTKGSLYKVYNSNLLYHGCIPLNEDGSFKEVTLFGKKLSGKSLYEKLDSYIRKGFFALNKKDRENGKNIMWYIWQSPDSPLFGKDKMTTFERYFIKEKETHKETKNAYYRLIENEEVVDSIFREFGLNENESHIINGHVPVKKGEKPVKCNGKVLIIDGGFSKAYQKETGIAGYTLIYNSYGLILVAHCPFESAEKAILDESDIHSESMTVSRTVSRKCVGDTDIGREIKENIKDLEKLLEAYRCGELSERV